jgi:hypothetical protein
LRLSSHSNWSSESEGTVGRSVVQLVHFITRCIAFLCPSALPGAGPSAQAPSAVPCSFHLVFHLPHLPACVHTRTNSSAAMLHAAPMPTNAIISDAVARYFLRRFPALLPSAYHLVSKQFKDQSGGPFSHLFFGAFPPLLPSPLPVAPPAPEQANAGPGMLAGLPAANPSSGSDVTPEIASIHPLQPLGQTPLSPTKAQGMSAPQQPQSAQHSSLLSDATTAMPRVERDDPASPLSPYLTKAKSLGALQGPPQFALAASSGGSPVLTSLAQVGIARSLVAPAVAYNKGCCGSLCALTLNSLCQCRTCSMPEFPRLCSVHFPALRCRTRSMNLSPRCAAGT